MFSQLVRLMEERTLGQVSGESCMSHGAHLGVNRLPFSDIFPSLGVYRFFYGIGETNDMSLPVKYSDILTDPSIMAT